MLERYWGVLVGALMLSMLITATYLLHQRAADRDLIRKEYLINNCAPKLIFSGDSRAERQLSVDVAMDELNYSPCDIINIATSAGSPTMIEGLARRYPKKFKKATLIISISANSFNEGAIQKDYYPYGIIAKQNYWEQLITFIPKNTLRLASYYKENFDVYIKANFYRKEVENFGGINLDGDFGFKGVNTKEFEEIPLNSWYISPFYNDYRDSGLKQSITKSSLLWLKQNTKAVYVYVAPFSPDMMSNTKAKGMFDLERSFQNNLEAICAELDIPFKSYLASHQYQQAHFYDAAHLNLNGAKIFTKDILKVFNLSSRENRPKK
jgi:hypothetical protein